MRRVDLEMDTEVLPGLRRGGKRMSDFERAMVAVGLVPEGLEGGGRKRGVGRGRVVRPWEEGGRKGRGGGGGGIGKGVLVGGMSVDGREWKGRAREMAARERVVRAREAREEAAREKAESEKLAREEAAAEKAEREREMPARKKVKRPWEGGKGR